MSNYLSAGYEVNKPPQDENFPLLFKTMEMRQGKYDANKAKAEQTLAFYGENLKGLRDEDNQYIAAKLNDLSSTIKEAGDLSLSSNSDAVMTRIGSISKDPIVQSAVLNRVKMDNFNKDYAERVKKGDGSANQLNYSFALEQGKVKDYMDGKSKNIGTLNYTPYYDDHKEFTDISENLNKYVTDIERTTGASGGYIYTQKGKQLTEEKVKQITSSLLSDNAKRQMSINAWGTYDKGTTEEEKLLNVTTEFNKFKTKEFADLDAQIEEVDLKVKNKDVEQSTLDALKAYRKELEGNYEEMISDKNRSGMYTRMYSENKLNAFSQAHAVNNVNEIISADSAFAAAQELKFKREKEAYDRANPSGGKAPKVEDSIQTKSDPDFKPESEQTDWTSKQEELIGGLDKVLQSTTNDVYSRLDVKTQQMVDNRVKNSKGTQTRADVLINLGSTSTNIVSAADFKNLTQVRLEKALNQQTLNKYTEKATQEANATLDSDAVIGDLYNNSSIKILWKGADGRERLMSARDVMIGNGIVNNDGTIQDKLSSKPGVLAAVKKSILADKFISSSFNNQLLPKSKELIALAQSFGEDIKDVILTPNESGHSGKGYQRNEINPNTKTGKLIALHQSQGGYDKGNTVDSFDDISSVSSYLKEVDPISIRKKVGDYLAKDQTLAIGKVTTVDPGTPAFKKLASQAENINVGSSYSIQIRRDPSQPNMVKISQYVPATASTPASRTSEVSLKISELAPEITNQINLQNTKQTLTVRNIPDVKQKVRYGNIDARSSVKDIAETHFGGIQGVKLAEQTTRDGALKSLFKVRPDITGTQAKPTEIGILVKKIIDDESLLVTLTKGSSNDAYPTVIKKVGDVEKTIFKSTDWVDDRNAQAAYDRIFYTPQLILNGFIAEALQDEDPNKLKELYGE